MKSLYLISLLISVCFAFESENPILWMNPPLPFGQNAMQRNYRIVRNPELPSQVYGTPVNEFNVGQPQITNSPGQGYDYQPPQSQQLQYTPPQQKPVYGLPTREESDHVIPITYNLNEDTPVEQNQELQQPAQAIFEYRDQSPLNQQSVYNSRPQENQIIEQSSSSSGNSGFRQEFNRPQRMNSVECQMRQGADNRYRFTCEGIDPRQVTLKSEQILWLQNPSGSPQSVDIEVPNYRTEDFIKAYFKQGTRDGNNQINILLKKPQQTWEAAAQNPTAGVFKPQVNLQYEPARKPEIVHYPRNRPYNREPLPDLRDF